MSQQPTVVVTGASSGIGLATVQVLLKHGFRVFGTVRREQDAERLTAELPSNFHPLRTDVADETSVHRAAAQVAEALGNETLAGLVNNAGIAVSGPMLFVPLDQVRRQLEVNLIGPIAAIQAFGPLLGSDRSRVGPPGRIVNMSSVGGRIGAPFLGPYVASKFALEGVSDTLRRELLLYGIDVVVVGPGSTLSAIWDKAEAEDISAYRNTDYGPALLRFRDYFLAEGKKGLPAERVGEVVLKALTARRPKVRYAVVPGSFQNWTLPRLLPKRIVDKLIGKQFGLQRPG